MDRQSRLLGVLLILQVLAKVVLGSWLGGRVKWERAVGLASGQGQVIVRAVEGPWVTALEQSIIFDVYFLAPMLLLLLAGLGFVLLRRRGWMLASVAQSLIMLACLFYYGDSRPWFAYPIIAYSILMILLLNSRSVRAVVHRRRTALADARPEVAHGE